MSGNIFQQAVVPVKPNVIAESQLFVYVPVATNNTKGIASYNLDDFELTNGEVSLRDYNPLEQASRVKLSSDDFEYSGEVVSIKWPIADETKFGLTKLKNNGYLQYESDDTIDLNFDKLKTELSEEMSTKPTYGANASSGFVDYDQYVDSNGIAKTDAAGRTLLAITKEAVGLSKVENKAFNEYVYNDFSQDIKNKFIALETNKLDASTWNALFSDWQDKSEEIDTPYKWLNYLDSEQAALWDSIGQTGAFLGVFETSTLLESRYPASDKTYGSSGYVIDTHTYWAVKPSNVDVKYVIVSETQLDSITGQEVGDAVVIIVRSDTAPDTIRVWNGAAWGDAEEYTDGWEWYNTNRTDISFFDAMETRPEVYQPDGLVGSAGSSGKWAQSNHIHPSDPSKLNVDLFKQMNLTVTSTAPSTGDFNVDFWERDQYDQPVINPTPNLSINIPYVRTAQYLHNWEGAETTFSAPNNEYYWAGDVDDFNDLNMSNIPNGSLLIVDDGEGLETGDFVTASQLAKQGVVIDSYSHEKIVTILDNVAIAGLPVTVTMDTVNDKYRIVAMSLTHPATSGHDPMLVVVPGVNGNTIAEKYFTSSRILATDTDGTPTATTYLAADVLTTEKNGSSSTLAGNKLLISGSNNTVSEFNSGVIDGMLLASDGSNGVKTLTLTANKLMASDSNGKLVPFGMSAEFAGYYVGVSQSGAPTLIEPVTNPTSLPVLTFNSNPATNQASTVLVFADPQGNYRDGCLYFY